MLGSMRMCRCFFDKLHVDSFVWETCFVLFVTVMVSDAVTAEPLNILMKNFGQPAHVTARCARKAQSMLK